MTPPKDGLAAASPRARVAVPRRAGTARAFFCLVGALAGLAPAARAADDYRGDKGEPAADAAVVLEARERFQRGVRFYREGDYDAALAEFVRAHELAPNFRILYNLGQVQAERHDYVGALRFFEQYLLEGGALVSEERRAEVEQTQSELSTRVARLALSANVPGTRVIIDDVPVALLPLERALLVNPGERNLRIEKAGYLPQTRALVVPSGETLELSFTLVAEPSTRAEAPPAPPAPPPPPAPVWDARPFWISVTATATLGTTTAAFALATAFTEQPPPGADIERLREARARQRTFALLTGGFGTATLVSAGAAAFFLVTRDGPEETQVGSMLVPSTNGVHWVGSF